MALLPATRAAGGRSVSKVARRRLSVDAGGPQSLSREEAASFGQASANR